ncbi:MAG: protein jag [Ruminococcaceae bacterium]|nr:protein jag [Oscillospiraceae bacterium]
MSKVITVSAKTVEEALEKASEQTGVVKEELKWSVITEAKKGLFGIGAQDAVIEVSVEESPDELALNFVKTVLADLEFENVNVEMTETSEKEVTISVTGDDMGLIIGHHGEILESLQYLTNLAANKGVEGYRRYIVDVENYRAKREEALRKLAQKTAARAKRQGRNVVLEPMSAYERRAIHSEVQNIEGVTTYSVGSGDQRKVVVSPENQKERPSKNRTPKASSAPKAPKTAEPKAETTSKLDPDIPLTYAGSGVSKQPIVKAKSIEELGLADPDDSDVY